MVVNESFTSMCHLNQYEEARMVLSPPKGNTYPEARRTPAPDDVSVKDEVPANDVRAITSGVASSSLAELGGAGEITPYPAHEAAGLAAEGGKRRTRTPVKHTPNTRPRARARTEERPDAQSGGLHGVSGGSSAMTPGQLSETSSSSIGRTRSGRVQNVQYSSGERAVVGRRAWNKVCGLARCGSTAGWEMIGERPCKDCGGGVIHTGEEFLCAACHRTSKHWRHLGPNLLEDAIAWYNECRAAGVGLPRAVVKSFVPSGTCLCMLGDCFYYNLRKVRFEGNRRTCIPCGTNKSSFWRTGGERGRQYQLYFTGEGLHRTDRGMRKTKEVITAVSDICNACYMAFYAFTKSTARLPTTKELLAAPPGNKLPQGIDRANVAVVRHMYEELEAGNMVCSEDIAVVLARERRDNKLKDLSDKYLQATVSNMMKEVGEGVGDVCVRKYSGSTFGEDGRKTLVYLLPTNINVDVLASTDRKFRRMHRTNQNLCQQLQDARGNGVSRSVSAAVTPRMHDERVEAAKIAGMVVREDISAAPELPNVRRVSTYEDDTSTVAPAT